MEYSNSGFIAHLAKYGKQFLTGHGLDEVKGQRVGEEVAVEFLCEDIDGVVDGDGNTVHKAVGGSEQVDLEHALAKLRTGEEAAVEDARLGLLRAVVEKQQVEVVVNHVHHRSDGETLFKVEIQYR